MLFDLKPKEEIKDFFNYREELNSFASYLTDKNRRMVVIRGLRRSGKSSLLRVGLRKARVRFVLIDVRELTSLSRRSFESKLLEELKSTRGLPASLLERIDSVEAGLRISLKKEESAWKILKKLNPVIAVDEVQMLKGTGVESFFAALYDNTNCKIVLTGSEVGVLDAFVGKDNPKAPLFGRVYSEIKMHPLVPEKSEEFLALGFKEAGRSVPEEAIDNALKELDGIVGWLAMFGNLALSLDSDAALKKSIANGAKLAYSELETFLNMRLAAKKRYLALLRILAEKDMKWGDLKRALQIELKEMVSDPQFSNYLNSLKDYGFILHVNDFYSIPDPLLRRALARSVSNL
jgi:hypothetical protein